jgi:CrcB protein
MTGFIVQAVAIGAGGAIGALLRFWSSTAVYALLGRGFPYGTLFVNIVGSFLMGLLFVLLVERLGASAVLRAALLVGVLGGFTTFSSFSIETLNLLEQGELLKAVVNTVLSVALCIGVAWLGMKLGRQW